MGRAVAAPPPLGVEDLAILADVRSALFGHARQPLTVGRYVIGERIGRGGAGCVFRAFDPDLDRQVAVKLVQERGASRTSARRQVFKEAQALARLSHPNVVEVYDVGEYALPLRSEVPREGVFIAMELLAGKSLQAWLDEAPRPVHEIVAKFAAAGRGLAAAHAVELVHRDFKPSNVFLTDDGAVKVLDFGVAGIASEEITDREATPTEAANTRTSHLGGTPWYMAPEQYAFGHTDPRSDQWSFCFALREALSGRTPAADIGALQRMKLNGDVASTRGRSLPARVRRVLARGLSPDPQRRFASMHALLAGLEGTPARGRVLVVAAGVAIAASLGTAALASPTPVARLDPALASIFAAIPDADLARAETLLEAGRHDEALALCRRMLERSPAAQADLARALLCRARVDHEAGQFEAAAQASERAYWTASEHDAMDVAARAAAQAAIDHLALSREDAAADWVRHGEAAVRRATGETAYIEADLALARASTLAARGRDAEALPLYEKALADLTRVAGEHSRASAHALGLVGNCLQRLGRAEEALPKHTAAVEELRALLGEQHLDVAAALNDRATSLHNLDRNEDALVDLQRALAIVESLHGPNHPDAGMIRHNIGFSLNRAGRRAEALEEYRRALAIRIATHGPDHFKTLKTLNNLGQLLVIEGHVEEGERMLLEALARYEERPPHPLLRQVLQNLARAAEARGDATAAARWMQRRDELVAQLEAEDRR